MVRQSFFVVASLRRGDLAVHVVERGARPNENSRDRKQPACPEPVIDPLSGEEEDDDRGRELDSDTGEFGTRKAARRRSFPRTLFVSHSQQKITACEDFHKPIVGLRRREAEDFD
jgi:hypothetical protein